MKKTGKYLYRTTKEGFQYEIGMGDYNKPSQDVILNIWWLNDNIEDTYLIGRKLVRKFESYIRKTGFIKQTRCAWCTPEISEFIDNVPYFFGKLCFNFHFKTLPTIKTHEKFYENLVEFILSEIKKDYTIAHSKKLFKN